MTKPNRSSKKTTSKNNASAGGKSTVEDIQLTHALKRKFNAKKHLVFSDPKKTEIESNGKKGQKIVFYRIGIETKYPDGSQGPLIFELPKCFSYGVSENRDNKTDELQGHSMCLILSSKDENTPEQDAQIKAFRDLYQACLQHIVTVRKEIGKPKLKKIDNVEGAFRSPIYQREDDETGEIDPEAPVKIYPKLIESRKSGKVITQFYDVKSDDIIEDPLVFLKDKKCFVYPAVKVESIYIGARISLQLKIYQVYVEVKDYSIKKLLPRPVRNEDSDDEGDDDDYLNGSSDDEDGESKSRGKEDGDDDEDEEDAEEEDAEEEDGDADDGNDGDDSDFD